MYWLVDLRDPADFGVSIKQKFRDITTRGALSENHIYTTEPDILSIATIVTRPEKDLYTGPYFCKDVLDGKISLDTVKNVRHYFIIGERLEIVGRLVKITEQHFKIVGVMGGNEIYAAKIYVGPPYDD
jgi:hypothetical protein